MSHSDDKGLVLPPRVAPTQVVLVPITKGEGEQHELVMKQVDNIVAALKTLKIRTKVDRRSNMRPGAKYFEWERKGVPLRIDVGPRDLQAGSLPMTIRHSGEKAALSVIDLSQTAQMVQQALLEVHSDLLLR